jgi:hypothetical protein
MNDPENRKESASAPGDGSAPAEPGEAPGASANPLTKEEQWALFEKELKESDWGHQPC